MYTIIIPSIGRTEYLIQLLRSIENQTLTCTEIIILLDQKLNTYEKIKKLSIWGKVKIIINSDTPAKKRNMGIKKSKNELIFLSDDDDIWHHKKAELVISSLINCDVVCHNYDKFGLVKKINCSKLGNTNKMLSKLELMYGDNIFGGGSSIASHKKIFLEIPFDEKLKFTDDLDWWIRIFTNKRKYKVFYLAKSLVKYRSHNKNITKLLIKVASENIKLAIKNMKISFYSIFIGLIIIIRNIFKLAFCVLLNK